MKKLHWLVRFLFGPVPVYFSALAILIVLTNAQYFGLVGVGVAPRAAKLASTTPVVSVMKYCDIFRGEWVPDAEAPYYNHKTCHMIQEHQNCLKYGRPDLGFLKWRWRPSGCDLPRFDPLQFLQFVRGKSLAFVGDSLARNHMQSLLCLLSQVAYPKDLSANPSDQNKVYHYRAYNFTISMFWSPFLVRAREPDHDGPAHTGHWSLYLDEADDKWVSQISRFDYVLVSAARDSHSYPEAAAAAKSATPHPRPRSAPKNRSPPARALDLPIATTTRHRYSSREEEEEEEEEGAQKKKISATTGSFACAACSPPARANTPAPPSAAAMLLHLLPLSCPAPPFRLRGGSPRVRAGGRARTRALRGADVEPETPPRRRRRGRDDDHDPHAAGSGGDTGALLASVRRLLLSEAPTAAAAAEEEEELGQFPKRWAIVFLCFSAFLLCNMDRVNMSIAILPMSAEYGWNPQTVGLIQSSFFWGYLLTQIAGGIWADTVGGKTVLGFGVVWWSIATALTPVAAKLGLPFLLVVRAFMGIGEGVAMPAMNNILSKWVPVSERSRSLALVYSGMYLGSVTGLAFSPLLIHKFGWPSVFYSFGSLGAVWVTTWATKAYSSPLEDPGISAAEKKLIASQSTAGEPVKTIPWRLILSKPPVWALIVSHFCHNWGTFILLTWMPTYYNQVLKFNLMESGLVCVLPWFTMAVSANVGGWIADTLVSRGVSVTTVRKIMQSIGFLGPAFFLTQLSHVDSPAMAVLCMACSQGTDAFSQSGLYSNHQDIGPRYAGVLLGLSNTAGVLAGVFGTAATGYILQHGSWDNVFELSVVLYLVGTLVWNVFSTGEKILD